MEVCCLKSKYTFSEVNGNVLSAMLSLGDGAEDDRRTLQCTEDMQQL